MTNQDFQWKLLTVVSWVHEAQYIRTLLEGSDIECFVPDELTGVINPIMTTMRIRVMVRQYDLERAKEILEAYKSSDAQDDVDYEGDQDGVDYGDTQPDENSSPNDPIKPNQHHHVGTRCPACLSGKPTAQPRTLWNYLLFIVGVFALIPMRRARDRMRCEQCGSTFT